MPEDGGRLANRVTVDVPTSRVLPCGHADSWKVYTEPGVNTPCRTDTVGWFRGVPKFSSGRPMSRSPSSRLHSYTSTGACSVPSALNVALPVMIWRLVVSTLKATPSAVLTTPASAGASTPTSGRAASSTVMVAPAEACFVLVGEPPSDTVEVTDTSNSTFDAR